MLLCTAETFQQHVLHEKKSLDTIKRTHLQSKQISVCRVSDCVTRTNRDCVTYILQAPHKKEIFLNDFSIKNKVRRWTHAQRSCAVHEETLDITKLFVIDETTQCGKCKRTQCQGEVLLHMWSTSAGVINRKDKNVERHNGAGNDSLERFAVANQDKRSVKKVSKTKTRSIFKNH